MERQVSPFRYPRWLRPLLTFLALLPVASTLGQSAVDQTGGEGLRGRVVFGGVAVPGATVIANDGARKVEALSGADGAFRIPGLTFGRWSVLVQMQGFHALTRTVSMPDISEVIFDLSILSPAELLSALAVTNRANAADAVPMSPAALATTDLSGALSVIQGSVNNAASSQFAQPRAIGNNRPTERRPYSGALTIGLGHSSLDAAPFSFLPGSTQAKSYSNVQVGFALAGPLRIPGLVRRGPEISLSYERRISSDSTTRTAVVPTGPERAGDLSTTSRPVLDPLTGHPFAGNRIPVERLSRQALALLALYPLPNRFSAESRTNYEAHVLRKTISDSARLSTSGRIADRTSLSVTASFEGALRDEETVLSLAESTKRTAVNVGGTLSRQVSARLQVVGRYQFAYRSTRATPHFAGRRDISGEAGIVGPDPAPENWGPPTLVFPDIIDLRSGNPDHTLTSSHQLAVEVLHRRGRHEIKIGAEIRWEFVDLLSVPNRRGILAFTGEQTGTALADFLLGLPATSSIALGGEDSLLQGRATSGFINDDIRLAPGVTLNAGLRWEHEFPYTERRGRLAGLVVDRNFRQVNDVVSARPLETKLGSLQPRLALAWRPRPASSLLLRASYGHYRNTGLYQSLATLMAQQPPLLRSVDLRASASSPLTLASPFATSQASLGLLAVDPGIDAGQVQTWEASVHRDLPGGLAIIAAYSGERGSRLLQAYMPNTYPAGSQVPCPSCPRGFVYLTSGGASLRHAARFYLRRRLHNGLSASIQYTLAKSTDDASTFDPSVRTIGALNIAQDWLNLGAERSLSTFDRRHLLEFQAQYIVGARAQGGSWPRRVLGAAVTDWTIATQVLVSSGTPHTPTVFAVVEGTSRVGVRPSLTGISPLPIAPGTYANPSAFEPSLVGSWGDAGRNSIRGPGRFALDASLSRPFKLRDRLSLEALVTATNLLNRVSYSAIDTVVGSPRFGLPTAALPMRRIHATLKLRF